MFKSPKTKKVDLDPEDDPVFKYHLLKNRVSYCRYEYSDGSEEEYTVGQDGVKVMNLQNNALRILYEDKTYKAYTGEDPRWLTFRR